MEKEVLMPDSSFFTDKEEKIKEEKRNIGSEDTLILGDADADGLVAAAIIDEAYQGADYVSCGHHGTKLNLADGLEIALTEFKGERVIVEDICPDSTEEIEKLENINQEVLWFDHHEWDKDIREIVSENSVYLEVDKGEDEKARCTAQVVYDYYESRLERKSFYRELSDVTAEYDLWRLNDERGFDLNDLAIAMEDKRQYIEDVQKFGADIYSDSQKHREIIEDYREKKEKKIEMVRKNVTESIINGLVVHFAYGNCDQSMLADRLKDEEDSDLVVNLRPDGTGSLRGSDNFERCDELAKFLGGGGHEKAAGFSMDIKTYSEYSDMWNQDGGEQMKELKKNVRHFLNQ